VLLGLWTEGSCFLAYDCMNRTVRHAKFDVLEPSHCEQPEADYQEAQEQVVQILQSIDEITVEGYQCKATVTRSVTRCQFDSLTYGGTVFTEFERNLEITPQQCRAIQKSKSFVFEQQTLTVTDGAPISREYFSHGSRDNNGNCVTDSWFRNGAEYKKSFEQTVLRLEARPRSATVALADNAIFFKNSLQGAYRDGNIQDVAEGTIVWDVAEGDCTNDVSTVYYGGAMVHQPKTGSAKPTFVLIHEPEDERAVGLILGKAGTVCGVQAHKTQIRGLSVVLMRPLDRELLTPSKVRSSPRVDQDLRSQNSYLHLTAQLTLQKSFHVLAQNLCELERSVLQTKLNMLATSSRPLFGKALFGAGKKANVAGRVAYVSDCPSVEVTRRDYPNCTVEIPVRTPDHRHLFADPLTFFLVETPQVVPCDPLTPIMWKVGESWYCANPDTRACESPGTVSPNPIRDDIYELDFSGFRDSLFTPAQWEQHERSLRTYDTRTAVVADLANVALLSRENDYGTDLGVNGLLTLGDLSSVTMTIGNQLLPFFSAVGNTYSILIGTLVVANWIKVLFGWLLRTAVLYRQFGCSPRLLVGFWSTLTAIFMLPLATLNQLLRPDKSNPGPPSDRETGPGTARAAAKELEACVALPIAQAGPEPLPEDASQYQGARRTRKPRSWSRPGGPPPPPPVPSSRQPPNSQPTAPRQLSTQPASLPPAAFEDPNVYPRL
jgi:hypothetical protein